MAHELHCIGTLRDAMVEPKGEYGFNVTIHAQHCLNYIRQWIMCSPDLTLEPFDPLKRNFALDKRGATHVCRDWTAVYAFMDYDL